MSLNSEGGWERGRDHAGELEGRAPDVQLVSLPWTTLNEPSLGLAILKSVLQAAGIACRVRHQNLFALDFLKAPSYYALANVFALNDFLFSGVLDPDVSRSQLRALRGKVQHLLTFGVIDAASLGGSEGVFQEVLRLRADVIPAWLERLADDLAAPPTTMIGLTCMFDQTVASLALAHLVKQRRPEILIALGGYAVRSPTAEALLSAFPCIDAVCVGEGEPVVVGLARASVGLLPLDQVPGIVHRSTAGAVVATAPPPPVILDQVPDPDFDDFYRDVETLAQAHHVHISVPQLPVENSRGCWWGAKHHCVFCGIHDDDLSFRARTPERVLEQLNTLSRRYGVDTFRFSDYILPHTYYHTLLPALRDLGRPYRIITEMKANVTPERFALMADAGFIEVQPGVESFSSQVLGHMDKGVTAVQNVQTLVLGRSHGVKVHYNLLYGLPTDRVDGYEAMLAQLPRLVHLDAPSTRLEIQITRYAPLQTHPERFGLPPARHEHSYELIFSPAFLQRTGFDLDDFCYYFERPFEYAPRLRRLYRQIDAVVDRWSQREQAGDASLTWSQRDGTVEIVDTRPGVVNRYVLPDAAGQVLLACVVPRRVSHLAAQANLSQSDVDHALATLEARELIFVDGDHVVALPVRRRTRSEAHSATPLSGREVATALRSTGQLSALATQTPQ